VDTQYGPRALAPGFVERLEARARQDRVNCEGVMLDLPLEHFMIGGSVTGADLHGTRLVASVDLDLLLASGDVEAARAWAVGFHHLDWERGPGISGTRHEILYWLTVTGARSLALRRLSMAMASGPVRAAWPALLAQFFHRQEQARDYLQEAALSPTGVPDCARFGVICKLIRVAHRLFPGDDLAHRMVPLLERYSPDSYEDAAAEVALKLELGERDRARDRLRAADDEEAWQAAQMIMLARCHAVMFGDMDRCRQLMELADEECREFGLGGGGFIPRWYGVANAWATLAEEPRRASALLSRAEEAASRALDWLLIANCKWDVLGDIGEAGRCLRTAEKLINEERWWGYGQETDYGNWLRMEERGEALRRLTSLEQQDPVRDVRWAFAATACARDLDRPDISRRYLALAEETLDEENRLAALLRMAWCWHQHLGEEGKARALLEQAAGPDMQQADDLAEHWQDLVLVLLGLLGDQRLARRTLDRMVELSCDAEHSDVLYEQGMLLLHVFEDRPAAHECLEEASRNVEDPSTLLDIARALMTDLGDEQGCRANLEEMQRDLAGRAVVVVQWVDLVRAHLGLLGDKEGAGRCMHTAENWLQRKGASADCTTHPSSNEVAYSWEDLADQWEAMGDPAGEKRCRRMANKMA